MNENHTGGGNSEGSNRSERGRIQRPVTAARAGRANARVRPPHRPRHLLLSALPRRIGCVWRCMLWRRNCRGRSRTTTRRIVRPPSPTRGSTGWPPPPTTSSSGRSSPRFRRRGTTTLTSSVPNPRSPIFVRPSVRCIRMPSTSTRRQRPSAGSSASGRRNRRGRRQRRPSSRSSYPSSLALLRKFAARFSSGRLSDERFDRMAAARRRVRQEGHRRGSTLTSSPNR